MRRRRIGGLIIALAVATSACSLVTSLDGLSSGIDATDGPRVDGAANDATDGPAEAEVAPPPTDAADALAIQDAGARDDAGPNLHPAGTFENGTCDPWHGFQGSIGFVTLARTGGGACRACTASTTTDYFTADDNGATGADMVGATYRAEGWVRTDPTAPAPLDVKLFLRNASVASGSFVALESSASVPAPIDATWQHFETSLSITKQGYLNVFVGATHAPNACFILDDVTVRRVN
jgi:hypothetical protein